MEVQIVYQGRDSESIGKTVEKRRKLTVDVLLRQLGPHLAGKCSGRQELLLSCVLEAEEAEVFVIIQSLKHIKIESARWFSG